MSPLFVRIAPPKAAPNWHELFIYDPDAGRVTWRISRSNRQRIGGVVGSVQTNHAGKPYEGKYLHVRVGRIYLLHRIIYEMMSGEPIPKGKHIDHWDGDGQNNRWKNLRLATRSQNMGNRDRNRHRKHDLPKGIRWHRRDRLYVAWLGNRAVKYTKSLPEAVAAYEAAAKEYYGEFARTSPVWEHGHRGAVTLDWLGPRHPGTTP